MEKAGRADMHCHTSHSGFTSIGMIPFPESVTSPEAMVDAAARKGLSVLGITDHDTVKGALIARRYALADRMPVDVIIGEEITTADGELLGLFLEENIPKGRSAAETVDMIHSQGGIAIAPHPFSYQCPSLGNLIEILKLDGVEVLNAGHRDGYVNRIADLRCGRGLARIGSSDAHAPRTLANAHTEFRGCSGEDLRAAVRRGDTVPGGTSNTLSDYISWSVEMAQEVSRKLMTPREKWQEDDPLRRMNELQPHNKIIALLGSAAYASTPLPLLAGFLGEGVARYRGRKMWHTVVGAHPVRK